MKVYFLLEKEIIATEILDKTPEVDDYITIKSVKYIVLSKYYEKDYARIHLGRV